MKRYRDLNEYAFANRKTINKTALAKSLDVWPSKLTTLLNPDSYRVALDDQLVERIAELLNQTPDYVRKLYRVAA